MDSHRCSLPKFISRYAPEIVQFREMLEAQITQGAPPLETIPEAYNPLIAKLVHERSVLIYRNVCDVSGLMMCGTATKPSKL